MKKLIITRSLFIVSVLTVLVMVNAGSKNVPLAQADASCNTPSSIGTLSATDQSNLNCVLKMKRKLMKQNGYVDLITLGQHQPMNNFQFACTKKGTILLVCPSNPLSIYDIMKEQAIAKLNVPPTNFVTSGWFTYENGVVQYFMGGTVPDPNTLPDSTVICGTATDFGANPGNTGWSFHLPKTGDNETAIWCGQNNGNVDAVCSIVNQQGYDVCLNYT